MLDAIDDGRVGDNPAVWEKVLRKVHTGAMPPAGMPRPDEATASRFVSSLETALDGAAAARPDPGRPAIHRLNRDEYANAIRDLLALEVDTHVLLPGDDSGYGFDNTADSLRMSSGLLERYLSSAKKISRLAVGDPTIPPGLVTYSTSRSLVQNDRMSEDLPFGSRGGIAIQHYFPVDAEYVLKIKLQKPPRTFTVPAADRRAPGSRAGDGVDSGRRNTTKRRCLWQQPDDRRGAGDAPLRKGGLATRWCGVSRRTPHLLTDWRPRGCRRGGWIRLAAPSRRSSTASRLVARSTRCDLRRPRAGARSSSAIRRTSRTGRPVRRKFSRTSPAAPIVGRSQRAMCRPSSVSTKPPAPVPTSMPASNTRIERLLVDPNFLFRVEDDPVNAKPGTPYRIGDLELASRLSFFLWSSIPDDELFGTAEQRSLRRAGRAAAASPAHAGRSRVEGAGRRISPRSG